MPVLRISHRSYGEAGDRVEVSLEGDDGVRRVVEAGFDFAIDGQDREDLRWYLEDYLQYPFDPAPEIAARTEEKIATLGKDLFEAVFGASGGVSSLWYAAAPRIHDTRVEIVSTVGSGSAVPWELMREPATDAPLALQARSFIRTHPNPARVPLPRQTGPDPVRMLLVICRPRGGEDVPFRSVARQLVRGLDAAGPRGFRLDVLRPPTFERLASTLREAQGSGTPYDVVHFDGHGGYGPSADLLYDRRSGEHGYLVFEDPDAEGNARFVGGPTLGRLLVEAEVPLLVLNACRSSQAGVATVPGRPDEQDANPTDAHARVRAFGSLAQEVMDAGVTGVVAHAYNLYVVTAARFVAELYDALAKGQPLGEAVTLARKHLADQPVRDVLYPPRPLQDWCVPVVYEAAPVAPFPRPDGEELEVPLSGPGQSPQVPSANLPAPPDAGFFGRDETLLALDRAFDSQHVALLHASAGAGKTTTATEFARWFAATGGARVVLFTSFERPVTLPRVLDAIERAFGGMLESSGVDWLALDDLQRREVALQVLRLVPVLWVWDNVEEVVGFPSGAVSVLSEGEQRELAEFLRRARATKARFVLTSRREEREWLGDMPVRVAVPPMLMREQVQLANAIAQKQGSRLDNVEAWLPLLDFTQGNPLTLTVVVRQALRDGLVDVSQILEYVSRLRAGEAALVDEGGDDRARSLGASLQYGFENAFSEDEGKAVALLQFFQGFVGLASFVSMATVPPSEADWSLQETQGFSWEHLEDIIARASETGLLGRHAGGNYFPVHPALPWFLRGILSQHYPELEQASGAGNPRERAERAFAETLGAIGHLHQNAYDMGDYGLINAMAYDEANFLYARTLALSNGWWEALIGAMQGLKRLYKETGRRAAWKRLVEEIVPEYVDLGTDRALSGREPFWSTITAYRAELAVQERGWDKAERLQKLLVNEARAVVGDLADLPPEDLSDEDRAALRNLGVSLDQLALTRMARGKVDCESLFKEAGDIYERIGADADAAYNAFNLAKVYVDFPEVRDLAEAESLFRKSLRLQDAGHPRWRGVIAGELAIVVYERYKELREASRPAEELVEYLMEAQELCVLSLNAAPQDVWDHLAVTHNLLGLIFSESPLTDLAVGHFREAVRYAEGGADAFSAATFRYNAALALYQARRFPEARLYVESALGGFISFGNAAAEQTRMAMELVADIEREEKNS